MEVLLDQFTIVAAGSWNPAIFNPQWVSSNLFGGKPADLEVAFGLGVIVHRIACDGMVLSCQRQHLAVHPQEDLGLWIGCAPAMVKVLRTLSHTPIAGVGVNCGYSLSETPGPLAEALNAQEKGRIAAAGATIEGSTLQRRLQFDDGLVANISLQAPVGSAVVVTVNLHGDVNSASGAAEWLEKFGNTATLGRVNKFLESVYGLDLKDVVFDK